MTILVNIPISGRDGNTLFEISFNHCPPRLQKIWFVSSALQSNTFNFTATTSVGKHTAAQAESPTFCYFGELPKHNYCFGRNRTRNRKDFSSFGKTEFRPKWPKFGRKPKPNLFRSYTTPNKANLYISIYSRLLQDFAPQISDLTTSCILKLFT